MRSLTRFVTSVIRPPLAAMALSTAYWLFRSEAKDFLRNYPMEFQHLQEGNANPAIRLFDHQIAETEDALLGFKIMDSDRLDYLYTHLKFLERFRAALVAKYGRPAEQDQEPKLATI